MVTIKRDRYGQWYHNRPNGANNNNFPSVQKIRENSYLPPYLMNGDEKTL
jgi:hypothetical protein